MLKITNILKTVICIAFYFLTNVSVFSQHTIEGNVSDTNNNPLSNALVLLKKKQSKLIDQYKKTDQNGYFSFTVNDTLFYFIEIKAKGYINETLKAELNKSLSINLIQGENKIEEVVVSKKKPFIIKQDTLVYNVDAYKTLADKKVEDVLKKLPGIVVDDKNGQITYKNKPVEIVMIDNDDLFGYNYTIGTKNINVDMVDQIEAIENYTENKLLKGIESSNKVALNLKLKKGKTNVSGDMKLGSDFIDSYDLNGTLLGINERAKLFGLTSYNNIGINHSPFDYFSMKKLLTQRKEQNQKTRKLIPEKDHSISILDDNRGNINQALFSSVNSTFKVNEKLKAHVNYHL